MDVLNEKKDIGRVFDSISLRYDFLNHLLSLSMDKAWRRACVGLLPKENEVVLDLATGTGDLAIEVITRNRADRVIGVDISLGMLALAKEKIERLGLQDRIELKEGKADGLEFEDNCFDAVTIGFGVRNFIELDKSLMEIQRVMKPKGRLVVLEFPKIENRFIKFLFNIYFKTLLPLIGNKISKHGYAYNYLIESIDSFLSFRAFEDKLKSLGFKDVSSKSKTLGMVRIFTCSK